MRKYIGWIIVGTLVLYLLSVLASFLLAVPTLLAWLVPLLIWPTLGKGSRNQSLLLMLIGCMALLFAAYRGIFLGWQQIFAANLPLLAMFVAVSFLGLTTTGIEAQPLPKGKNAVITTAFGAHLLGAVINLSVLFFFGDRLQKNGTLTEVQMIILARSFCAAGWWSPFFVATGVALTYAPGMSWQETLIPGAIMSVIAIGYSIVEVCYFRKTEFFGYPLKKESLTVPVSLAAVVIVVHHFLPEISILNLICLLSPAGALVFMKGRPRIATLHDFIDNRVASVSSQFTLFLAAGVFSTGIKSIILVYPALFNLEGAAFTPMLFSLILATMILIGIMGIHPIVSVAIVSPLLLPLNPGPSQLGFLFLSSWAVSTGSSPLSGVGLALVSRYQASPRGIIQNNWHYAMVMWAMASVMNILFFTQ
ncbi:MAG: hypothetical protein KJ804_01305 [Proteobacteria bacterium]|nr:hypothetical protein [Pseudomonadota bacterium]MBU1056947.1 hypothetical protein [Pseudomonadota bacterium]